MLNDLNLKGEKIAVLGENSSRWYMSYMAIACGVGIGRTYIIPIAEKDFDFYNAFLPEKIQSHNAITFASIDDVPSVVEKIINKIESKQ